jgi:hypothetical protein
MGHEDKLERRYVAVFSHEDMLNLEIGMLIGYLSQPKKGNPVGLTKKGKGTEIMVAKEG